MKHDHDNHPVLGGWDLLDQLLLILIGLILLLANTGVIDQSIVGYWPAILIVFAVKDMIKGR